MLSYLFSLDFIKKYFIDIFLSALKFCRQPKGFDRIGRRQANTACSVSLLFFVILYYDRVSLALGITAHRLISRKDKRTHAVNLLRLTFNAMYTL